jgi:ssDNA-specific exonuclease RecJ
LRIFLTKCDDPYDEPDSIWQIETPYIISYSSDIDDYSLLINFPDFIINEDIDGLYNATGMNNLTFKKLIKTLNSLKKVDMSKVDINDGDDFTYCD